VMLLPLNEFRTTKMCSRCGACTHQPQVTEESLHTNLHSCKQLLISAHRQYVCMHGQGMSLLHWECCN